jgi:hypothetical protein
LKSNTLHTPSSQIFAEFQSIVSQIDTEIKWIAFFALQISSNFWATNCIFFNKLVWVGLVGTGIPVAN